MIDATVRSLVGYSLKHRHDFPLADWSQQGFGFLRLRLNSTARLHIWDSRLRVKHVSDIHDHAQWEFSSYIVAGLLLNQRYRVVASDGIGVLHHTALIKCGVGGGMGTAPAQLVKLYPRPIESYGPGQTYQQNPDEVHRTHADDGTITLIEQRRTGVDTAQVYWPYGEDWVDAIPTQATAATIEAVAGAAYHRLLGDGAIK